MTAVLRCEQCGGSVAYDAVREAARCLFCGSVALAPAVDEPVQAPSEAIAFAVGAGVAEKAFRSWARASWWVPRELRSLRIGLHRLWLPAWRVDAEVELHWTGLAPAPTRSGRRPSSGIDRGPAQTMIPASLGLSQAELDALQPFEPAGARSWRDAMADDPGVPWEVPALSRSSALARASKLLTEERRRALARRERLSRCRASALVEPDEGRLLMLPVWIGSFRHRDRPWRFVINAQSGRVHGRAPLDRVKVGLALALALLIVAGAVLWYTS